MNDQVAELKSSLDGAVNRIWDVVVRRTNQVLYQADLYGYGLMHLPEPNVQKVAKALHDAIPAFERLLKYPELGPDNGLKIERARQAVLYLQDMAVALKEDDEVEFTAAVENLQRQAMF